MRLPTCPPSPAPSLFLPPPSTFRPTPPQPVRRNSPTKPLPMADYGRGGDRGQYQQQQQHQKQQSTAHQLLKAVTAVATGGSLLAISGLTMAGTVIVLAIATPLLVIFSPVLVPAAIAIALIISGFLTSGGFGVAALSVLAWMYRYLAGQHPVGADQIDQARARIAAKARDIKESAQQKVEHVTS
ncbi:oleosin 16 kDa [Dendrobium catenatum]|nr:oleosin 16 kDa [Dendrobium catenatum]